MAVPRYNSVRKIRHEFVILLLVDLRRDPIVVRDPIMQSVDILQASI